LINSPMLMSQIACLGLGPVPSEERELMALSIRSLLFLSGAGADGPVAISVAG
jgi:hypothetical protein